MAVDQQPIADQVHQHRDDAGAHGHQRLPTLAQAARVHLGQHEGRQARQHDAQVGFPIFEGAQEVAALGGFVQVQTDQRPARQQEHRRGARAQQHPDPQLISEGLPDALLIALAVILRGKDARAGEPAEDAQVEHEDQLIDDGHAGHGLRAHLPDHDIVQQADEVGDAVLHHDRHRDPEHHAME